MVTEERRVSYDGEETLTGLFDEDQKNIQADGMGVSLSLESPEKAKTAIVKSLRNWCVQTKLLL